MSIKYFGETRLIQILTNLKNYFANKTELETAIAALTAEDVGALSASAASDISTNTSNISSLQTRVSANETNIDTLNTNTGALAERVAANEANISSMLARAASLEAALAAI